MSKDFDISCAVPQFGRTLTNFLNKLKTFGVDAEEIDSIISVMEKSKAYSGTDFMKVTNYLKASLKNAPPCFNIVVDRKRPTRPYRVGFLGYTWDIGGIRLRVEGSEPHNGSSLIHLDEVDFTVVGLDELLSMTQPYLRDPTTVTKWGMYNYHLDKPTTIRVAGSSNLTCYNKHLKQEVQDIVGFFLISKPGTRRMDSTDLEYISRSGQRIFVKGRYTRIVEAAYPGIKLVSVDDVEDAVMNSEKGRVGIEIVQTGNTLQKKGLILHGSPLFLSESLYVVDYYRYCQNKDLRSLIKHLEPMGYFDKKRIEQFALWYHALETNLGESWVNQPKVEDLWCHLNDAERGLRPYRLKTRYWSPDDHYQKDEAIQTVIDSKRTLQKHYETIRKKSPDTSSSDEN